MSDPIFKFVNASNRAVSRTWPSGKVESYSVDATEYQEWLTLGNIPLPADPAPAPIDQGDLDQIQKQLKAAVNLTRIYCNAVLAGTYTQKTSAQTKVDFKQVFDNLP